MTSLVSLLFEIIKSEVLQETASDDLYEKLSSLTEDEWACFYRLSKAHDYAHVVGSFLDKCGIVGKESTEKFKKQFYMAVFRYESLRTELESIEKTLEVAEIPYVALKGAVIRDLYPEPWMRTSCDIDVLVSKDTVEQAAGFLMDKLGYNVDPKLQYHDLSLYSPNGVHLELHFNIQENMEHMDKILARVWEHTKVTDGFRYKRQLTNEFLLFYHIAHMAHHFVRGGCGIKPFLDLHLLHQKWLCDTETVRSYCKECGLERFYDSVTDLAQVWFKEREHTDLTERMEAYVLRGGVYGTSANRIAVQQVKQGGKIKYALSCVFLPYDNLKKIYPCLEKHRWMTPFFQIRRWGRIVFCGRIKHSARELGVNGSISKESVKSIQLLLSDLGL